MFRDRFDSRHLSSLLRSRSAWVRRSLGTLLVLGSCVMGVQGCGKQGEGERCDRNNVNQDCEAGLACREVSPGVQLCCTDPATSTVDACRSGGTDLPEDDENPPAQPEDAAAPPAPADAGDAGA